MFRRQRVTAHARRHFCGRHMYCARDQDEATTGHHQLRAAPEEEEPCGLSHSSFCFIVHIKYGYQLSITGMGYGYGYLGYGLKDYWYVSDVGPTHDAKSQLPSGGQNLVRSKKGQKSVRGVIFLGGHDAGPAPSRAPCFRGSEGGHRLRAAHRGASRGAETVSG